MTILALILILSLSFVRDWGYEIFTKFHSVLAIVALAALLWHLRTVNKSSLCPLAAGVLWLLNCGFRLYSIVRRSRGAFASIEELKKAVKISVHVQDDVQTRLGQYYYLYFPDYPLPYKFQAHPLMVMRCDKIKKGYTTLVFVMERQEGISHTLGREGHTRVILDGPWGIDLGLERYERVILVGEGIGIAGLLSCAFHLGERMLMRSNESQGLRTKKLDLYWVPNDWNQAMSMKDELQALQELDANELMRVWLQFPDSNRKEKTSLFKENLRWKALYKRDVLISNLGLFISGSDSSHERMVVGKSHSFPRRIVKAPDTSSMW